VSLPRVRRQIKQSRFRSSEPSLQTETESSRRAARNWGLDPIFGRTAIGEDVGMGELSQLKRRHMVACEGAGTATGGVVRYLSSWT
jgi:hypothetical protein